MLGRWLPFILEPSCLILYWPVSFIILWWERSSSMSWALEDWIYYSVQEYRGPSTWKGALCKLENTLWLCRKQIILSFCFSAVFLGWRSWGSSFKLFLGGVVNFIPSITNLSFWKEHLPSYCSLDFANLNIGCNCILQFSHSSG